ncbi:MAG: hypothetical protein H7293_00095 [Candidatus Saccharibacteria bacterium]|nr:hypothetical protein [Rhodoferax sp.]
MGLFDLFTSTKRPETGVPIQSVTEIRARLLALNRDTAPYQLIDGTSEGVDIIAQWKIVDAKWYEIFAKAGLSKTFKIYLKFDEAQHAVRAKDYEYTVSWRAGVPNLELNTSSFSGQTQSVEFGAAYGFTEKLSVGEIYNYRFNTGEIKKPIQAAVTSGGWIYKGVAFGAL